MSSNFPGPHRNSQHFVGGGGAALELSLWELGCTHSGAHQKLLKFLGNQNRIKYTVDEEYKTYSGFESSNAIMSNGYLQSHKFMVKAEHVQTSTTLKVVLSDPGHFAEKEAI